MSILDSVNETAGKATKTGEAYAKATQEYYRLKVFQQLSLQLSSILKIALMGGLLFLAMVFFTVAGAITLGEYLENMALGLVLIGGFLVLVALVVLLLRKQLETGVIKKLSAVFFKE